MTRYAAVDCGTNSIRLLISDYSDGTYTDIYRGMEIIRLGAGVDATGEIAPEAIERARVALEKFVDLMINEHVVDVRMAATSASRDASNREDFFDMTAKVLGRIKPGARAELISGDEEAALSFQGAVGDLTGHDEPYCVIDLGGGSTEFIVGKRDGEILGSHSAQMGCVRVTERIMRSDPPTETEIDIARDYVRERLADTVKIVPLADAKTFVGVAGTFTTLSALAQGLEEYDADVIHGSELRFDALRVLTKQLVTETARQRAEHPVIHPGRADVISGGAVVVEEILATIEEVAGIDSLVVSEKDILDGLVASLVSE